MQFPSSSSVEKNVMEAAVGLRNQTAVKLKLSYMFFQHFEVLKPNLGVS